MPHAYAFHKEMNDESWHGRYSEFMPVKPVAIRFTPSPTGVPYYSSSHALVVCCSLHCTPDSDCLHRYSTAASFAVCEKTAKGSVQRTLVFEIHAVGSDSGLSPAAARKLTTRIPVRLIQQTTSKTKAGMTVI